MTASNHAQPAQPPTAPAVFLDRDDTLIRCTGVAPQGDLGDPRLVEPLPGVPAALRSLRASGFGLVVVTNQGGVARGRYTESDVHAVHQRLNDLCGGLIDAFRFCPWHPGGTVARYRREHPWRKPAPGMILDAAHSLGIDLGRSWMVGDAERDIRAGAAAGCRTIRVGAPVSCEHDPDYWAADVSAATEIILAEPVGGGRTGALGQRGAP